MYKGCKFSFLTFLLSKDIVSDSEGRVGHKESEATLLLCHLVRDSVVFLSLNVELLFSYFVDHGIQISFFCY